VTEAAGHLWIESPGKKKSFGTRLTKLPCKDQASVHVCGLSKVQGTTKKRRPSRKLSGVSWGGGGHRVKTGQIGGETCGNSGAGGSSYEKGLAWHPPAIPSGGCGHGPLVLGGSGISSTKKTKKKREEENKRKEKGGTARSPNGVREKTSAHNAGVTNCL